MKDCLALNIAGHLLDGGWEISDRAEIQQYYELTDNEIADIIRAMEIIKYDE